ncbi:MAG: hypothetical protein EOL86_03775 [Deltaproteobacteria bacterium]|nr:hypothetical protein [Deltaproteobacteria bacterium]
MRVAILSNRRDALGDFAQGLEADVDWIENPTDILGQAASGAWQLVVVDAMRSDLSYKSFLMDLLGKNAMLNSVVITDMDEEAFHEDSEGLGVLCAVPAQPGRVHGEQAMKTLRRILGLG